MPNAGAAQPVYKLAPVDSERDGSINAPASVSA